MDIFTPSIILAIFPYIFIGSFPIVGLILVTKWLMEDIKRYRKINMGTKRIERP
jgi:hypothetical protein